MDELLSTREVARYLRVHEKQVYGLLAKRGLPGTKVTGKWLFPRRLVDQWIEESVENRPLAAARPQDLLVIAGSDDPLLGKSVSLYQKSRVAGRARAAVYAPLGSAGGLRGLRNGWCRLAGCHIYDPASGGYNRPAVLLALGERAQVYRFASRQQGFAVAPGNPKRICGVEDLSRPEVRLANRSTGSGTRTLLLTNFRPEYDAPWMNRSHYQQVPLLPLGPEPGKLELAAHLMRWTFVYLFVVGVAALDDRVVNRPQGLELILPADERAFTWRS